MVSQSSTFDHPAALIAARSVIDRHPNLAKTARLSKGLSRTDLENELAEDVWMSFNRGNFDVNRSKFKTWATMVAGGRLIDRTRRASVRSRIDAAAIQRELARLQERQSTEDPHGAFFDLDDDAVVGQPPAKRTRRQGAYMGRRRAPVGQEE